MQKIDKTKAYYDRLSRWYDLLAGQAELRCKQRGLELLHAQPGEIVLEIGFGTGHCLQALAGSVGNTGEVHGIDLSSGMLQVAQRRLRQAGMTDRVELRQGDALQLPYENEFFDTLFMSFTLELFANPEIPILLKACKRVLCSQGRMCIVSMGKKDPEGLMIKLYQWAHQKWPTYIDCHPIDARSEIEQAGFHTEQLVQMSLFGLPVDIILARP
jgi:ubiquinone/menaquinone biosynthesis C-methylase UbiE